MFKDKSLIPSEAVRLCALGMLAEKDRAYGDLASEVRQFAGRLIGPSLDLIGAPIELMKFEGLVTVEETEVDPASNRLSITAAGRAALNTLLNSHVREPVNDVSKLVIALKMRFLHHLSANEKEIQIEALAEMCERELARLIDLQERHAGESDLLAGWLEHDIDQVRRRLAWFEALSDSV